MQCPCGSDVRNSQHEVTTMKKAREWISTVVESDLPLIIESNTCRSCGRLLAQVFNKDKLKLR